MNRERLEDKVQRALTIIKAADEEVTQTLNNSEHGTEEFKEAQRISNQLWRVIDAIKEIDLSTEIDLFDRESTLPREVVSVIERFEDSIMDYNECKELVVSLEKLGYTCDYGLDAVPYGLKKI